MEDSSTVQERSEFMIPPTGGLLSFRKARFLEPTLPSTNGPRPKLKLPSLNPKPIWPIEVSFTGWRDPLRKWKTWLKKMQPKYSSVWEEAGIYDAILGSTHKINVDEDLMFGLAERWNSETNTFIFPWGEATVTLEDVSVLAGLPTLGGPVFFPLENEEMNDVKKLLEKSQRDMERLRAESHVQWLNLFMDSGSEIEHEAFLSLWLSRSVFPGDCQDKMNKDVFAMAVNLARGRRLALAPAVLASVYRDLGLLKETMAASVGSGEDEEEVDALFLNLWSPLSLVQVWAWERFPGLRPPQPNFVSSGVVRMGRWDGLKGCEVGNVRVVIDRAGDSFLWRPYAMAMDEWTLPGFYVERERYVKGGELSVEFESFARCLRACQLVGIDCQEPYNPHRVSMQFGYDQDLPGWICRDGVCMEMAWYNYSKGFGDDEVLYFPCRLSESDVSTRYLEWWRKTVLCPVDEVKGWLKRPRSYRKPCKDPKKLERLIVLGSDFEVCSSKRKRKRLRKLSDVLKVKNSSKLSRSGKSSVDEKGLDSCSRESLRKLMLLKTANDPEVPPGFSPRGDVIKSTVDKSSKKIIKSCSKIRNQQKNLAGNAIKPRISSWNGKKEGQKKKVFPIPKSQCCRNFHRNGKSGRSGPSKGSAHGEIMKKESNSAIDEPQQKILLQKTAEAPEVPPGFLPRCVEVKAAEPSMRSFLHSLNEVSKNEKISTRNDKVSSSLHSEDLLPSTSDIGSVPWKKLNGINLNKDKYLVKKEVLEVGTDESAFVGLRSKSNAVTVPSNEKDSGSVTKKISTCSIPEGLINGSSFLNIAAMSEIEARFKSLESTIAAMKRQA